jgi:hypothetical protein
MPTGSSATGTLYLISAVLAANNQGPPGARRIRDSYLVRSDKELRYVFPYSTVLIRIHRYASVPEAVRLIEEFEAKPARVDGVEAAYTWSSLRPDGGPQPTEDVVRILLCEAETGTVGQAERESVFGNTLDFGEHTVVVSPAGISIAGDVPEEQIEVYLYYVAQIGAAVCRYAENEQILDQVMVDIRARAAEFDVEKLQHINVSTSKAMLDISDELLKLPPRENFILRALLKVANIDVYEQRIARMLGIVQHHVTYRNALIAKRNSERIEFVLFVIAVLSAFSSLAHMFLLGDQLVGPAWGGLVAIGSAALCALVLSLWFRGFRARVTAVGPLPGTRQDEPPLP